MSSLLSEYFLGVVLADGLRFCDDHTWPRESVLDLELNVTPYACGGISVTTFS